MQHVVLKYLLVSGVDGSLYFRCPVKSCVGRIRTDANCRDVEIRNGQHNHLPCPEAVKVRNVTQKMREEAKSSTESIGAIYRRCTATLASDPQAAATMPSLDSVDSGLYRKRHRLMPPLPKTREELVVPDIYANTSTGEHFLLHQSVNSHIIIFCTPSNLKLLCSAAVVCIDGTFDAVPALYTQLFTLHVFEQGKLLPLVYCLLSSKERAAYAEVFSVLKVKAQEMLVAFAPQTIMSDYESGMIAAVRDELPNAHHQGCYFHFTQVRLEQIMIFIFHTIWF